MLIPVDHDFLVMADRDRNVHVAELSLEEANERFAHVIEALEKGDDQNIQMAEAYHSQVENGGNKYAARAELCNVLASASESARKACFQKRDFDTVWTITAVENNFKMMENRFAIQATGTPVKSEI